MEFSSREQAHGPPLLGLLARIGGAAVRPPSQSLSARLAQWIDWREAVALSAALDSRPAPPAGGGDRLPGDAECERVRDALTRAIEGDRAFAAAGAAAQDDVAFYRQRFTLMQQIMDAEIRHLRGRLRARLAQQNPAMARLCAMDAAMEQALAPRERALLAPLADLLDAHFGRLRQAAQQAPDSAAAGRAPADAPAAWLGAFRKDMKHLLLAELDVRLQSTQCLLAALRTADPGHHAP